MEANDSEKLQDSSENTQNESRWVASTGTTYTKVFISREAGTPPPPPTIDSTETPSHHQSSQRSPTPVTDQQSEPKTQRRKIAKEDQSNRQEHEKRSSPKAARPVKKRRSAQIGRQQTSAVNEEDGLQEAPVRRHQPQDTRKKAIGSHTQSDESLVAVAGSEGAGWSGEFFERSTRDSRAWQEHPSGGLADDDDEEEDDFFTEEVQMLNESHSASRPTNQASTSRRPAIKPPPSRPSAPSHAPHRHQQSRNGELTQFSRLSHQPINSSGNRLHAQTQPPKFQRDNADDPVLHIMANHDPYAIATELVKQRNLAKEFEKSDGDKDRALWESRGREEVLGQHVVELEGKLEELRKELNTSRAFVESEDAGDVESVVKSLNDISAAIDDLAFQIIGKLDYSFDSIPINDSIAEAISSAFSDYGPLARACHHFELNCEDFLLYAITSVITMNIYQNIFAPFRVGLPEGMSDMMHRVYKGIRQSGKLFLSSHNSHDDINSHSSERFTEPQDRAARWRSITYERCSDSTELSDQQYCASLVTNLLATLSALVTTLVPSSSNSPVLDLSEWSTKLFEITNSALLWRTKTMKSYLSYDYEPTNSPRVAEVDGYGSEVKYVAISSFGLWSMRSVEVGSEGKKGGNGKGEIRIEEKCMVKVGLVTRETLGQGVLGGSDGGGM